MAELRSDAAVTANDKRVELIEKHVVKQSVSRIEELVKIFIHATKVSSVNFK